MPAEAQSAAIPWPMTPAPMTPAFWIRIEGVVSVSRNVSDDRPAASAQRVQIAISPHILSLPAPPYFGGIVAGPANTSMPWI